VKFKHHDLEIELPDEWWEEAEMVGFVPKSKTYCTDQTYSEAAILDVGPVIRAPGVNIFNDNEEGTAHDRVLKILRGFKSGQAIPPVEIIEGGTGYPYPYELAHGTHRLYCSLAAGFTHVPWVKGFKF
jgi:hypothetical protein